MELSSISFVYLFLPVSVLMFYAAPASMKNGVLLGLSLLFYAMADPAWLLVMVLSVGLDFVMASILEEYLETGGLSDTSVAEAVAAFRSGTLSWCPAPCRGMVKGWMPLPRR